MQVIIQKFEKTAVYIALAAVWAVAVFSPDVSVNENAITQLTIIVFGVLVGTGRATDVIRWLAINRNFKSDFQKGVKYFEAQTNYDVPEMVELIGAEVADTLDKQFEAMPDNNDPDIAVG